MKAFAINYEPKITEYINKKYSHDTNKHHMLENMLSNIDITHIVRETLFNIMLNMSIFMLYSGLFLMYFSTTLGKLLFNMKILDAKNYKNTTKVQCMKRIVMYPLFLINIFVMLYDKKTQGLHDKFANTIVVQR
ncbi:hypothetical protein IHI24_000434 [Rickettsia endosymbiont of Cardiosporidium cionae]|nr:hypothetical protein IHI24_000434 [Rickettsia endosymbiont of Cardiosporidium cionae]